MICKNLAQRNHSSLQILVIVNFKNESSVLKLSSSGHFFLKTIRAKDRLLESFASLNQRRLFNVFCLMWLSKTSSWKNKGLLCEFGMHY